MFIWPASALPMIRGGKAGFTMSEEDQSWMSTVMYIVNFLSPIPAGYVMDWIGRKTTLLLFDLLAVVSWLVVYFCHSSGGLYAARALSGAWSGCVYTVVPVLIGETFPPAVRGSMGAVFGICLYLGGFYETLVGAYATYDCLALVSFVPTVLLFLTLLLLPESPQFHVMKGRKSEAGESIEWLRGSCTAAELDALDDSVKAQLAARGTFLDLLTVPAYRKAFVITECLAAFRSLAGLSLLFTYATIAIPPSFIDSEESFLVLVVVWICGSLASFFLMDRFGRRTLVLFSSVGSCLTMFAVAVWYYLRDFTGLYMGSTQWFPLIGLVANGIFYSMGLVSIPILIQGEIFPANIKAKASALACISIAFTSGVSVKIYEPLTDHVGQFSNFLVCSLSCAVAAVFALTFMIETRGKTIEEIQLALSGKEKKLVA